MSHVPMIHRLLVFEVIDLEDAKPKPSLVPLQPVPEQIGGVFL